ncbi:hypothetical protein [Rhodococcus sp. NPDC058639]|uniref:hypothetical protein n=1 Tax=Rhodococcus sp. NPDC058639 TaxID=3346570 RepID=UPI00364E46DF
MTEDAPNRSPAGATLDEKAGLTSGLNFWFTKPITRWWRAVCTPSMPARRAAISGSRRLRKSPEIP